MDNKRVRITEKEAKAIWHAAGDFRDEFVDYFTSINGEKEAERMFKSYESGMKKLEIIWRRKNNSTTPFPEDKQL